MAKATAQPEIAQDDEPHSLGEFQAAIETSHRRQWALDEDGEIGRLRDAVKGWRLVRPLRGVAVGIIRGRLIEASDRLEEMERELRYHADHAALRQERGPWATPVSDLTAERYRRALGHYRFEIAVWTRLLDESEQAREAAEAEARRRRDEETEARWARERQVAKAQEATR